MFVLKKVHAWWWPCLAKVPADGGTYTEQEFSLLFETVSEEEVKKIMAEVAEAEKAGDSSKSHDLLRRAVRDWKDIEGEDKKPVLFSVDAFNEALTFPWFREAAYTGWVQSQSGRERARKN